MAITDKEVKKILKRLDMMELTESVETYPEDERDGMTDMEILKHEALYFLEMYEEDGTCFSEDLELAREWLKETKNGKVYSLKEVSPSYITKCQNKTDRCRRTVNEYNRLRKFVRGR